METRPGAKPPIDDSINRVRTAADEAINEVKSATRDAAGVVKDRARETADGVQAKAAEQARTAASTLRGTADTLNGDLPWMKTALHKTADGFDHLTTALNRGDIGNALNGVSDFARRQPALFLGLSVAAGFALARVGKTAIEEVQETRTAPSEDEQLGEAVAPYAPVEI